MATLYLSDLSEHSQEGTKGCSVSLEVTLRDASLIAFQPTLPNLNLKTKKHWKNPVRDVLCLNCPMFFKQINATKHKEKLVMVK